MALAVIFAAGSLAAGKAAGPHVPADAKYLDGWRMAGANPQRTSWVPEEVRGMLKPLWCKRLEPYVSQKVQVIAADGTLFISTAGGLWALDAETGQEKWVYRTALPLGHWPTVVDGVAYVGCFDRKLHAVDAATGKGLWTFEAGAGFHTNPLVVDGNVYAGNRDGFFYCIDARTGRLVWRFQTEGPILYSAAYADGVVYFASNDCHAYALESATGKLVWKSKQLPGYGFHSWWPVVYKDRVIYAGSWGYLCHRKQLIRGSHNRLHHEAYGKNHTDPAKILVGPPTEQGLLDATGHLEFIEQKPWRRATFVLDRASGGAAKRGCWWWRPAFLCWWCSAAGFCCGAGRRKN